MTGRSAHHGFVVGTVPHELARPEAKEGSTELKGSEEKKESFAGKGEKKDYSSLEQNEGAGL